MSEFDPLPSITRQDFPCLWKIGIYNKGKIGITFSVNRQFAETINIDFNNYDFINYFFKDPSFGSFSGFSENELGFKKCFSLINVDKHWKKYLAILPPTKKLPKSNCNEFESNIDWENCSAISATLSTLFNFLNVYNLSFNSTEKQALTIRTLTKMNGKSCGVSGEISKSLRDFLAKRKEQHLKKVEKIMLSTYRQITEINNLEEKEGIVAYLYKCGFITLGCFGNRTGINFGRDFGHNSESDANAGYGYEFSSHNVDTVIQELTLIAGLAAICDEYYKSKTAN